MKLTTEMIKPERESPRTLLITMPLADPALPNLAIEQLASIARLANEPCDVFYGTLKLPRTVSPQFIHTLPAPAIFTPAYYDLDPEKVAIELAIETLRWQEGDVGNNEDALESLILDYLLGMDAAEVCLYQCLAAIPEGKYDIVGFAVAFDAQKLPSAALAQRLKAREPGLRIVFGGTGCDGSMGQALMEVFSEVDVVIQGEAERTFLPLLAALRGVLPFETVNNCLYRFEGEIRQTAVSAPIQMLDEVPFPAYHSFLQQRETSPYKHLSRILLFETSRGCWYGQKQHCLFCGIKSVSLGYRRRSAQNVLEQIKILQSNHTPHLLYATDAILDLNYLKTMLPEIARIRREEGIDFSLFYEIKSNMRREQIALLAAAGVKCVQPGIESLSTNILRLMQKGASGLQQIELLKWAKTYGLQLTYGLIAGTPGEIMEDYEQMISLMPMLYHLPPPLQVNRLAFHKFSPYAADPAAYGIQNIRPFQMQRIIYQASDEVLMQLCYELDYTHPQQEQPKMVEAYKHLALAVEAWRSAYFKDAYLIMRSVGDKISIVRRSADGELQIHLLSDKEATVYRNCQHTTAITGIAMQIGESVEATTSIVNHLGAAELVAVLDAKCLALAVPADADAWYDAGLSMRNTPHTKKLIPAP